MADSLEAKFEQLCSTILQTDVENWEARNKAVLELTKLVASYETRPDELDDFTPAVFRAVKEPIKQLITDLRSQQVRDVCVFLSTLSAVIGDRIRPLMRDVFSNILDGSKVSNKVMSGYVDECIITLIRNAIFKTAIPTLLLVVRDNKAKMVRERCLEYLNEILILWNLTDKEIDPVCEAIRLGLEDGSLRAREVARTAYLNLHKLMPHKAEKIKFDLPKALQAKLTAAENSDSTCTDDALSISISISDDPGSPGKSGSPGRTSGNSSSVHSPVQVAQAFSSTAAASLSSTTSSTASSGTAPAATSQTIQLPLPLPPAPLPASTAPAPGSATVSKPARRELTAPTPARSSAQPATPAVTRLNGGHHTSALATPARSIPAPTPHRSSTTAALSRPAQAGIISATPARSSAPPAPPAVADLHATQTTATTTTEGTEEDEHLTSEERAAKAIQASMRGMMRRRSVVKNPFAEISTSFVPSTTSAASSKASTPSKPTPHAVSVPAGRSHSPNKLPRTPPKATLSSTASVGSSNSSVTGSGSSSHVKMAAPATGRIPTSSNARAGTQSPTKRVSSSSAISSSTTTATATATTSSHPRRILTTSTASHSTGEADEEDGDTAVAGIEEDSQDGVLDGAGHGMHPPALSLNMRVMISGLKHPNLQGFVRFIGHTLFAPGVWLGVELDQPLGKNNGSVQGHYYFNCSMNHGIFVREEHCTPLGKSPVARGRNGDTAVSFSAAEAATSSSSSSSSSSGTASANARYISSAVLKLKIAQLMSLLNQELKIAEELEAEEKKAVENADGTIAVSKRAHELQADIINISSKELHFVEGFQKRWKA